jgi:hypothetical protein
MSRRSLLLTLLITLPVGCSHMQMGRTFMAAIESEDSQYFEPRSDFPVVAGDTGHDWDSESETRSRNPASEYNSLDDRRSRALKQELRALESRQSDDHLEFYEKHKHQFSTTSEKIYFLQLPPGERREYLLSRGFIPEDRVASFSTEERSFAVSKQDILMGMTKSDVMESWGNPLRVEVAGNPRNENERWLYKMNGASKYIYFESGQVQGWE